MMKTMKMYSLYIVWTIKQLDTFAIFLFLHCFHFFSACFPLAWLSFLPLCFGAQSVVFLFVCLFVFTISGLHLFSFFQCGKESLEMSVSPFVSQSLQTSCLCRSFQCKESEKQSWKKLNWNGLEKSSYTWKEKECSWKKTSVTQRCNYKQLLFYQQS